MLTHHQPDSSLEIEKLSDCDAAASPLPNFVHPSRRLVLAKLALMQLVAYSLPAHKELRFLLPALQLLMPYCGRGVATLMSAGRRTLRQGGSPRALVPWLLGLAFFVQFAMAVFFGLFHQRYVGILPPTAAPCVHSPAPFPPQPSRCSTGYAPLLQGPDRSDEDAERVECRASSALFRPVPHALPHHPLLCLPPPQRLHALPRLLPSRCALPTTLPPFYYYQCFYNFLLICINDN